MPPAVHALADQAAGCASHVQDYLAACAARIDAEIALVLEAEVEDPWLRGAISYHFGWAGADFGPPDFDDDRRLCSDGACTGLVGADGRCKLCGLAASQPS